MRRVLLASVGLVVSMGTVQAACIPTPSCSTLGYESSSSCSGGLKCPFGNYWNCTVANKVTELTTEITEIKKVIEEAGISGGDTSNCVIGSIFYSDHTCSSGSLTAGKTPIAVVVYSDGAGHGQAMALEALDSVIWGGSDTDILSLTNFGSAELVSKDIQSCANTIIVSATGDSSTYPAAWAAKEYSTVGTSAGDWCLPAAGIFTSIYNNLSAVNAGFILAGGSQITTSSYYWSSSVYDNIVAWLSNFSLDYGVDSNIVYGYKDESNNVRPVLEF